MKLNFGRFALTISLFFVIFFNALLVEAQSIADSPISSEPVSSPAPQPNPPLAPRKALTPDHAPTSTPSAETDVDEGIFDAVSKLPLSSENLPPATDLTDMLKDNPIGKLVTSTKTQTNVDPELNNICQKTDHPEFCVSMVSSNITGKVDVYSVLEVSMKVSAEHVKLAIDMANKHLGAQKVDSSMASGLRDCRDDYHDALDNLQRAIDALSTHDIGGINSMLSAMVADMSQCVDGFAGEKFPLTDPCQQLTMMASNCLAIAALIK